MAVRSCTIRFRMNLLVGIWVHTCGNKLPLCLMQQVLSGNCWYLGFVVVRQVSANALLVLLYL